MLYSVMQECKNYFTVSCESGRFSIVDGAMKLKRSYKVGQYLRIKGSVLNDGVYRVEKIDGTTVSFLQTDEDYPLWVEPLAAENAYKIGDTVTHNKTRYISRINANVYEPGTDPRWWEEVPGIELETSLNNEDFEGVVYGLAVPASFLQIVKQIKQFQDKQAESSNSGLIKSESFQNYSYTLADNGRGGVAGWKNLFSDDLKPYKKIFGENFDCLEVYSCPHL